MNSAICPRNETPPGPESRGARRAGNRWFGDTGQGLVEFAITLPLLLLLLLGTVEVGRGIQVWLTLNNAAAVGARTAAVGKSAEEVELAVRNAAATLAPDSLTVQIDNAEGPSGEPVVVRLSYDLALLTPILADLAPAGSIDLSATTVQRLE